MPQVDPEKPVEAVETGGSGDVVSGGTANQSLVKPKEQRKKVAQRQKRRGAITAVAASKTKSQRKQTLPATGEKSDNWRVILSGILLAVLSWRWWRREW
ncbi:hypothetical protein IV61_GL002331 [Levilactobacillus parabrevis]|nr:hypothetical protein IV61_GL002331 [Levilactobacillus parabrevis]